MYVYVCIKVNKRVILKMFFFRNVKAKIKKYAVIKILREAFKQITIHVLTYPAALIGWI